MRKLTSRKAMRALLACAGAAALAACSSTVGPNFGRPATPAVGGYAMAGDSIAPGVRLAPDARAAGPWWLQLGSADLDRTIRQALSDSPTVAEANARLDRARADAAAARGGQKAQVDANAGAQRERINTQTFGFTGFPSPTISLYQVGGGVSYDLDLFGRQRRTVEAADSVVEMQARAADAAYLTLTGNIALQAIRIAGLRAHIAAIQDIVADDRSLIAMSRAGEKAGGEASGSQLAGESQLAEDLALVPPLQRQLEAAKHQLALLVGKSPGEWTAPDFDFAGFTIPADIPLDLPSTLVHRRPDILAAEADLHTATAKIGVATAAQYPDIRLTAALTQGALKPLDLFSYDSSGWSIGAAITGPIFHGGTLKAQREAAEADARLSLARYQGTVIRAFVQVADSLSALGQDDQAITALTRAQTAAGLNMIGARKGYALGGLPMVTVVQVQRTFNKARRRVVEAKGQRYEDVVQLLSATAADWKPAQAI